MSVLALVIGTLIIGSSVSAVRAADGAATAGNPAGSVNNGTSPNDWFDGAKQSNWDVTDKISGGMAQILSQALIDFGSYTPKGGCPSAAANQAWNALADAANAGPLEGFLDAIKSGLKGAKDIATFGADPSAAAEAIEAGKLAEKAFEEAKDKGSDWLKEKLKEIWKGKPVEVLKRTSSRGGCDVVLVTIWDKAAQTYEITIYGDCHCKLVPTWGGGGSVMLKTFSVQLKGSVIPGIAGDQRVLNVGFPKITVAANCNCAKTVTGVQPPPTAPGTSGVQPGGGGGTPPNSGDGWRKLTTKCKACQSIVDQIHAAQDARDAMTSEFRDAMSQLQAAQSRGDKADIAAAQTAVDALTAREAGLIKLQQELFKKLKECEKKCAEGGTSTTSGTPPPSTGSPVPQPQRTTSPGTSTKPTSGDDAGNEGAMVPHTMDPNGYMFGTVVDETPGPSGFVYSTVNEQGKVSFFKSVTDAAKHFLIYVPAGIKLVEVAKHFNSEAKLHKPVDCQIGRNLTVSNTRDFPGAPPNGPAIVGGNSVYEAAKPIELHTREIDPRNVRVQIDGSPDGFDVRAASNNDVIVQANPGQQAVKPGPHTVTLQSAGRATNSMPTVLVQASASISGSSQIGATRVANFDVIGIPPNYPATVSFEVSGGSVFEGGKNVVTVPIRNGHATARLKNVRPGVVAVRWTLHVTIPGVWE